MCPVTCLLLRGSRGLADVDRRAGEWSADRLSLVGGACHVTDRHDSLVSKNFNTVCGDLLVLSYQLAGSI